MNFNPITLADSAATNTAANGPQSMILMIVWLAVIFGAMYFIMIRPQRKKQKEEKKMRDNLQVGDEIVTIGGIYGRVISLKEETIVIEAANDPNKLTIARWGVKTQLSGHDGTVSKKKVKKFFPSANTYLGREFF